MAYAKSKKVAVDRQAEMRLARAQRYISIAENALFNMASTTPYQSIDPEEIVKKAFAIADAYTATLYAPSTEEKKDETLYEEEAEGFIEI